MDLSNELGRATEVSSRAVVRMVSYSTSRSTPLTIWSSNNGDR